ncbi:Fe-S-cluster redox enzyme [Solibacillus sp. R5-41]|uniref:Fe-S-cluster redox enzyme n=1 Tax=Solibacillus sp. R5-41 TaxID=2048654 RepID=UPI000C1283D8|nr:Fe-S-cluster redox enzyme [Solibacillus sp. R5-41]ATP38717.1 Fe-S-cluster redox enzyme [Solibacillus sp. R5-41]
MLLSFDEQLLQVTNGRTGESFERICLEQFLADQIHQSSWGITLPSVQFLIDQDRAEHFCFQLVKSYWGKAKLFFDDTFQEANLNVEVANERVQQFFDNPKNELQLFNFLHIHGEIRFDQFLEQLFSKPIDTSKLKSGLEKIYVYKVNEQFLVQPIYSQHAPFWRYVLAKKIHSLFLQVPLEKMERPLELMGNLKHQLMQHVTVNRMASIIHKLIQQVDDANSRSLALKQLHLLNVRTHFTSGRRHFLKLRKCIDTVQANWSRGSLALNEKEKTLLSYMLFQEATFKKEHDAIIAYGLYLIEGERLNNHAIELVVEYQDVLSSMNPQPHALVKNYKANYLEHVFFVLIDTLVKENQFHFAIELLRNHELATCKVLFDLLQSPNAEQELHKIEASVQQDIAMLVDGSTQLIRESLKTWQEHYLERDGSYIQIAEMTSIHVCNILKILFHEEQDILLEKLLSIYKKYLVIPQHLNKLRQFIEQRVAVKM